MSNRDTTDWKNKFTKNKDLQDNTKRSNIHMIGVPGEEKQNKNKTAFEQLVAEDLLTG